jgi:excisionase family DNA binding protein
MTEHSRYYDRQEVAEILGVSTRTVQRWAADGRMPVVKMGRLLRFPRAEFDAWERQLRISSRVQPLDQEAVRQCLTLES